MFTSTFQAYMYLMFALTASTLYI